MELEPFQKPHPPFWSGVGTPDGGESAGRIGFNMVANAPTAHVRAITDRYPRGIRWHSPSAARPRPLCHHGRDRRRGRWPSPRRAYPLWHKHFHHLFQLHGTSPAGGDRPPQFDQIKDGGRGHRGFARDGHAHDQVADGRGRPPTISSASSRSAISHRRKCCARSICSRARSCRRSAAADRMREKSRVSIR